MPNALQEIWRPIVGYEGFYEVSDLGRVRRCDNHPSSKGAVPLRPYVHAKTRYCYVGLCIGGRSRSRSVHGIVAAAFHGPRPPQHDCAHIDGTRSNNAASNLRWVTRRVNCSHKLAHGTLLCGEQITNHKLCDGDVLAIFKLRHSGLTALEIGNRYGLSLGGIHDILARRRWKHVVIDPGLLSFPRVRSSSARKLTARDVLEIDRLRSALLTYAQIAKVFGVTPCAIRSAASRRTWKCVLRLVA